MSQETRPDQGLTDDELEAEAAVDLPDREALSVVTSGVATSGAEMDPPLPIGPPAENPELDPPMPLAPTGQGAATA